MMTGLKTVIWNVLLVGGTAALQGLAGYDWIAAVGDTWAVFIIAAINLALRWVTTTPMFSGVKKLV